MLVVSWTRIYTEKSTILTIYTKDISNYCQYWTSTGLHRIWLSNLITLCTSENFYYSFFQICMMTQQWVLHSHAQQYGIRIPILYNNLQCWANLVTIFICIDTYRNKIHTVQIRVTVGLVCVVRESVELYDIHSIWLGSNEVDLDCS